ncbi:MAG: hypothetical protein K9L60_10705 [Methylovulum sp.]|nr:hypothetical protein [Methylovulum sp.]MCF7999865.1 hypothetical protein [Methylovulum sp.]
MIATLNNWKPDDTTKPSRVNRKRKRRWKISDLIKSGLTDCYAVAQNNITDNALSVGRDNLFYIGVNTPLTIAVFLCASFCAVLCRNFIMAGCFGHSKGWLVSNVQYCHPSTTRRPSRDKLERWLISFSIGVTTHD